MWKNGAVIAGVLALAWAGAAAAQQPCDESAGTLGIQGLRCEGCTYSMSQSGIEKARFRTEPQVLAVARGFTRGDGLRAGDRIVAIDGALVTTREGSRRLVDLQAGQRITLRVRRDGDVVDLRLTAGSACELRRAVREREVEVDRIDDLPPGYLTLPPKPPAGTPLPPMPPETNAPDAPRPPRPPAVPPTGYLGFGIQCGECGIRDGTFFFSSPPTLRGVDDDGPAAAAGLRSGDVILAVDGQDITGPGAERFGEIEPGEAVRFTVGRDGEEHTFTVEAAERPDRTGPVLERPASGPPAPLSDRLRFEGRLGEIHIEVRGGPVTVTRNEETGELVIRTGLSVVRLTAGGG